MDRTYDADFRTAGVTVNGGGTTVYAYDADGLLTAAGAMALARDAANGQVTGTTLGVVADERTYNEHGEPTGYRATAGGTPVMEAAYTRDALGRITAKTETIQGTTANYAYSYDVAGRLVRVEKNGTTVEQYTYDANGNRTSGTAGGTTLNGTYDGDDKVAVYGGAVYTHAAGGEWRTVTEGGATTTYDYDAVGNLRTVTLPSGTTLEYVIDGRNRRVGRKVNGVLTKGYLYDGQLRIVAELDGANNVTARYVYGTRPNVPEWLEKGGGMYRIITDHLGSPRLVVNATSGAIVQRMDYDSWGNITTDTSPGFTPFGYAGGLHDQDTKLTRFGARDYDARTGRWTAKDPIGFRGGDSNVYVYSLNQPTNIIDPFGLRWVYSQSTGELVWVNDATGETNNAGTGYSGQGIEGRNNPNMQNVPNVGPIPQGRYRIGPQEDLITGEGRTLPGGMRLTPLEGTNTFDRDGFTIHGDNNRGDQSASRGCPIFRRGIRNRIANSGDNVLEVVP